MRALPAILLATIFARRARSYNTKATAPGAKIDQRVTGKMRQLARNLLSPLGTPAAQTLRAVETGIQGSVERTLENAPRPLRGPILFLLGLNESILDSSGHATSGGRWKGSGVLLGRSD